MDQSYCDRQPDYCGIVWYPGHAFHKDGTVLTRWVVRGRHANRRRELSTEWRESKILLYKNVAYPRVNVHRIDGTRDCVTLHTLILTAFIGPRLPEQRARHFPDPDPFNNALSNLSWGTHAENMLDKRVHGTSNQGERCGSSLLTNKDAVRIRELRHGGATLQELATRFFVAKWVIAGITNNTHYADA